MAKKIKYSEIFYSFQGEGFHTGVPTVWLRFFGCNLECSGFGQEQPTKPDTYVLPYKTFNIENIQKLEDLPVWDYGCDSSYSWSAKYKHLAKSETAEEITDQLIDLLPKKVFLQRRGIHLAFTGGEPMLWQDSMIDIVKQMIAKDNYPFDITVETNGTKPIKDGLVAFIEHLNFEYGINWFWSISPKLYNVSGEQNAVLPDIIEEYFQCAPGQLKFVLNNSEEAWDEVDTYVAGILSSSQSRNHIWTTPIYIMPVGATVESQTGSINKDLALIADKALVRGWSVSGRVHANIYGNAIAK